MSQIKSKYILDLNNCELFTKEHLSLHHDGFHPEVKGYEFFNQYEDCGIVYSHDQLMPIEVIDEIVDSVTNTQLYRKGDNQKRPEIRASFKQGFDTREKGIFVIVDDVGNVRYVFSGNTTHKMLGEVYPNIKNRMVHVFTMVKGSVTTSQVSMAGARHNALTQPEDVINWETTDAIIRAKFTADEYSITKSSTTKQLEFFREEVRSDIAFMGNGKFCTSKKTAIDRLLIALTATVKGEETIISFASGAACMTHLRTKYPIEFADDQRYVANKSVSIDYAGRTLHSFSGMVAERIRKVEMSPTSFASPEDTVFNIVCNFGTLDPSNVLRSIEHKVKEWYKDISAHNKAIESFTPVGTWKIQGFFNQSKELEVFAKKKGYEIPYNEVTEVDTWLKLYDLDYQKLDYVI